uniref:Uncharacterized protein n=1 Tax=Candidatus Kentrum eta TaxID=2126337 RepID=A0A450UNZ9_9GAMM|nr:MAG: hypothetical protein BECKH772B_GA0070898_100589 [Candidatus Kentron sp. H]VFJ94825.1 MAG: hypothetical protein BECKH772A_GA0070896_100787 [Candidatus Kentron sp. H]VFK01919.1 MAG: hypothetical protein BECKH772C_GA0070978_100768 [Candidatus Kentron sp. H]
MVLAATAELLLQHDLGFREMGLLVFPSRINVTRVPPAGKQRNPSCERRFIMPARRPALPGSSIVKTIPGDKRYRSVAGSAGLLAGMTNPRTRSVRTQVAYRFSGAMETIHAALVVRLGYTERFRREDQWKYAAEFSRAGHRLGFSMTRIEEDTGELEIYFEAGVDAFDRVTFIRFITDHPRTKGVDMEEQIRLYCPNCHREVENREAIEARVQNGILEIPCQFCDTELREDRAQHRGGGRPLGGQERPGALVSFPGGGRGALGGGKYRK